MNKVSHKLIHIFAAFMLVMFAMSTVYANPREAQALTVSRSLATDVERVSPESTSSYTYSLTDTVKMDNTTANNNADDSSSSKEKTATSTKTGAEDEEILTMAVTDESVSKTSNETKNGKVVLASGTKYATNMYIIRSNKPGPVVMIVGGVHGNETAGYKAAAAVKDYSIKRGTLLVIPEANKLAVAQHRRSAKGGSNLNRAFPQSSSQSADTTLAKAIYSAVKKYDVDWLMDMHEGYDYAKNKSTSSVGQSLIYYPNSATKKVAGTIVSKLNRNISSSYKQFSLLRYPVKGSLARSTAQYLGVNSFIFETCSKQTLSTRVNNQLKAANTLLQQLNMK
ncbi:MAG: succinylglutamate desuccinylase/aspartoacylase family protein [Syntrophomonadaceae bacterium]|nr:succinylglutamate desuccinylase/aspartoacylase family protein [Syntrophomonadaceae bacterium]MDD4549839.1 succinylglutamate desuccinylase/aspartoacylase family protein [Syntrophomonadaceae bacterium]